MNTGNVGKSCKTLACALSEKPEKNIIEQRYNFFSNVRSTVPHIKSVPIREVIFYFYNYTE